MQIILVQPCKLSSLPLKSFDFSHKCPTTTRSLGRSWVFAKTLPILRSAHFALCSRNDVFDGFSSTAQFPNSPEEDLATENRELGLLDKPFPVARDDDKGDSDESGLESGDEKAREDEALAPFL